MARAALLLFFVGPVCAAAQEAPTNLLRQGSYVNSFRAFASGKGRVAFIGGSITEMEGYRPRVAKWLQARFPDAKLDVIAAGISSTCSTTGAFRLSTDVFGRGPVDLLFVEFAVNDDQDAGHARRECIRGMEGILRHARRLNPNVDIVVTYFVNPGMLEQLRAGRTPLSMAAHEEVVRHYGVSRVHVAREVAGRIEAGTLTWKEYGGTHPKPAGNDLAAGMVVKLLGEAWEGKAAGAGGPHDVPEKPLDPQSYFDGRFVRPDAAKADGAWTWGIPDWKSLPGSKRGRFTGIQVLSADRPGSELTLPFTGRGVGAYVLAGPDAGTVEASIDGGLARTIDLYHRYSRGLHYPRTVMFDADLKEGKHVLRLKIAADHNPASRGCAVRIMQFAVNGRPD